jgi:hypothetical protein
MFRLLVSSAILTAALIGTASAQGILSEGAKWEKVSTAGKAFGEGVVDAKDGSIYLVDLAPPEGFLSELTDLSGGSSRRGRNMITPEAHLQRGNQ